MLAPTSKDKDAALRDGRRARRRHRRSSRQHRATWPRRARGHAGGRHRPARRSTPDRVAAIADGAARRRRPARPGRRGRPRLRPCPTACEMRQVRVPLASSASSTRPGPTSPSTPPGSASRAATLCCCAARSAARSSNAAHRRGPARRALVAAGCRPTRSSWCPATRRARQAR